MRDRKPNHNVTLAKRRLAAILDEAGADRVDDVELVDGDAHYKLDEFPVPKGKTWLDAFAAFPRKTIGGWAPPPVATYGKGFDPARIARRQWLIFGRYAVGEVTGLVSPPGVGKSVLQIVEDVSIVTGRNLLTGRPVDRSGEVLMLVGEEARRDYDARLAGVLKHYELTPADLGDRLHVVCLPEIENSHRYTLARMDRDVAVLNERMFRWLAEFPRVVKIGVDPLRAWHQLVEVSNEAMPVLCTRFRQLAVQAKRAVGFNAHVNKVSMSDPEGHVHNLAAVRGGTSIVADVRWAFTIARLSDATARAYGIADDDPDRRRYRRYDSLKTSYLADGEETELLRFESVVIENGEEIGVPARVDAGALRARGQTRAAEDERLRRAEVGEVLATMVEKAGIEGRCGLKDAVTWLSIHHPALIRGAHGKPLGPDKVRQRLPGLIGTAGIQVPGRGAIVIENKGGEGNGARYVIRLKSVPGSVP